MFNTRKRLRRQIVRLQIALCNGKHNWVVLRKWEHITAMPGEIEYYEDRKCSICELEKTFEIR